MANIMIISRPITESSPAHVVLQKPDRSYDTYSFTQGAPILITMTDQTTKHCVGWYDIATHTNHPCDNGKILDSNYESCFECRQKTGFNPAFYNTADISAAQAVYNSRPHSAYVAYFGGGLAKAGIMSDSRGLERIYEQGALLYCIIGNYPDATQAHNIESRLIAKGAKNSVTKRQKEKALTNRFDRETEEEGFRHILKTLDLDDKAIVSNLGHFFFGDYPHKPIEPIGHHPLSGTIRGVVGRYLVLDNAHHLYGMWLSDLSGFEIEIENTVTAIEASPVQASLFD